jgi:hypothetical protein
MGGVEGLTEPVAGCCEGGLFCSRAERAVGDKDVSCSTSMVHRC